MKDVDYFDWPVIVKPVDSAGSKGVSKVSTPEDLPAAIDVAMAASISQHFIIEDFLELDGFQSSADIFTVKGRLVYSTYSDQLFDRDATNPYVPAMEIWPSSMKREIQEELTTELQRLFLLLKVDTGIYNVESRLCKNGKAYIMEVSPRGGGNRIAEIQDMATGQNLIKNEILKALGIPLGEVMSPSYDGVWCNFILHSLHRGVFESIYIDNYFFANHVKDLVLLKEKGQEVEVFSGANQSLGTMFLRFDSREELDRALMSVKNWMNITVR